MKYDEEFAEYLYSVFSERVSLKLYDPIIPPWKDLPWLDKQAWRHVAMRALNFVEERGKDHDN